MSTETPLPESQIVPAMMLAALIAVTGLEAAYLAWAPHKAVAAQVRQVKPHG